MIQSDVDHSLFCCHSLQGYTYPIIYVNDIVITSSDMEGIVQLNQYLAKEFNSRDLGHLVSWYRSSTIQC